MPKIYKNLLKVEVFQYAKSPDLNMGYYHIQITEKASNLCTIILPLRKYHYKRLPVQVYNSPEIFHQRMNHLFHVFEFIRVYIDEILIFKKDTRQIMYTIWNHL